MKMRTWGMVGLLAMILAGAVVWADATGTPRKDYIIMEIESLPGDQVKIHITKPGQKRKVLEMTLEVTDKHVRVVDKDLPGVTTTQIKGDENGGGGKLVVAKWLDGSGTVRPEEVQHDIQP